MKISKYYKSWPLPSLTSHLHPNSLLAGETDKSKTTCPIPNSGDPFTKPCPHLTSITTDCWETHWGGGSEAKTPGVISSCPSTRGIVLIKTVKQVKLEIIYTLQVWTSKKKKGCEAQDMFLISSHFYFFTSPSTPFMTPFYLIKKWTILFMLGLSSQWKCLFSDDHI